MGPHIPSFSVKDLSIRPIIDEARPIEVVNSAQNKDSEQHRENLAMSARALGEAHFGDVESVDEQMNTFPVLRSDAESTDGSMNPPPIVQLERNQLDEPPESTDGKMYPARAELMETAGPSLGSRGARPLVDDLMDAVEDRLKQTRLF